MAALSDSALAQLVASVLPDVRVPASGLPAWETAYAVGRAESGGRPEAVGDGGNSFGIWQVYLPAHPQYSAAWLADPANNALAMRAISSNGSNWTPWCTWDQPACGGVGNGSYRNYLQEAAAALAPFRQPVPPPPPPPVIYPPGPFEGSGLLLGLAAAGAGVALVALAVRKDPQVFKKIIVLGGDGELPSSRG